MRKMFRIKVEKEYIGKKRQYLKSAVVVVFQGRHCKGRRIESMVTINGNKRIANKRDIFSKGAWKMLRERSKEVHLKKRQTKSYENKIEMIRMCNGEFMS